MYALFNYRTIAIVRIFCTVYNDGNAFVRIIVYHEHISDNDFRVFYLRKSSVNDCVNNSIGSNRIFLGFFGCFVVREVNVLQIGYLILSALLSVKP